MSKSNENNPHLVILDVGDVTAGAASAMTHLKPGKKWRLVGAKVMDEAGIAGDATDYVTVLVKKKAGATLATYTSNSAAPSGFVALVAGEFGDMALSATESDLDVSSSENLEVDIAHGGAGQALTDCKVQLVGFYV